MSIMKLTTYQIKKFQKMIFNWWQENRRDLPWRHTHDPYRILISEVMLQQTQVSRVLPKYKVFLDQFPDVYHLANASSADVLKAWKGMGYNRRALYLKRTAHAIASEHGGIFPKDEKQLMKLPGLGKYTARAVLVFAYKENIAMVDTNIRQIITHFFFEEKPQKESIIQEVADRIVPKGESWEWHQALMDYGAIAMSKVKMQKSKVKKNIIPFKESNRYYRGRIMDMLREGEKIELNFIAEAALSYQKSTEFIASILDGLASDGLISRSKTGIISLPE